MNGGCTNTETRLIAIRIHTQPYSGIGYGIKK